MIRAELTANLCSDEPNGDFAAYHPDNPTCFSCSLQILVGVHNQGGGELLPTYHLHSPMAY